MRDLIWPAFFAALAVYAYATDRLWWVTLIFGAMAVLLMGVPLERWARGNRE